MKHGNEMSLFNLINKKLIVTEFIVYAKKNPDTLSGAKIQSAQSVEWVLSELYRFE